jgi:hypothetical protein
VPWWAVIRGVERGGFGDLFDVLVRVRLAKIGLLCELQDDSRKVMS